MSTAAINADIAPFAEPTPVLESVPPPVVEADTALGDGTDLTPELLEKVAGMLGTTADLLVGATEEQLVIWLDDPDEFEVLRAAGHLPLKKHRPVTNAPRPGHQRH